MKKIFSIFASSVLALSMFVSCSGDLHNDMDPAKVALIMGETKTILDAAGIIGSINDWKNKDGVKDQGDALTKVDDTTYTYTFTAEEETEQFSIQEDREAQWSKPRWCGALKKDEDNAVKIEPKGEAAMVYSTDPDPSHFKLTGLTVGTAYKITITIVDADKKSLKAGVAVDGDAPAAKPTPTPYVLSGIFMRGIIDPSWGCTVDACLNEFTTDKDGNVFYQKDFVASGTKSGFKLGSKDWSNGWAGTTFKVGEDYVEFAEKRVDGVAYMTDTGDKKESSGDTSDAFVDGMTVGKNYRIIIKTTPEKKVYAKVFEILSVTFEFVIEGPAALSGQEAWINGSFWGGWELGWKQESWNVAPKEGYTAPTFNAEGKAVFGSEFNVSKVFEANEKVSYAFKVQYNSDWTNKDSCHAPANDLVLDFTATKATTYIVKVILGANDSYVVELVEKQS